MLAQQCGLLQCILEVTKSHPGEWSMVVTRWSNNCQSPGAMEEASMTTFGMEGTGTGLGDLWRNTLKGQVLSLSSSCFPEIRLWWDKLHQLFKVMRQTLCTNAMAGQKARMVLGIRELHRITISQLLKCRLLPMFKWPLFLYTTLIFQSHANADISKLSAFHKIASLQFRKVKKPDVSSLFALWSKSLSNESVGNSNTSAHGGTTTNQFSLNILKVW